MGFMKLNLEENKLSTSPADLTFPIEARDLLDKVGQTATVEGAVLNIRALKWGGFVILKTPTSTIQVVVSSEQLPQFQKGNFVRVTGEIKAKQSRTTTPEVEIACCEVGVLSSSKVEPAFDIGGLSLSASQSTVLDERLLSLRNPTERAIFQVQAEIARAFREFLNGQRFTEIFSPKIVGGNAEGGANVFGLDYFGVPAFLAQSPQFYKQFMVPVHGRVFEIGPVFRAEPSRTSRHLTTYTSMDLEMGPIRGFEDVMQMEAAMVFHVITSVRKNCAEALELFSKSGKLQKDLPELPDGIPQVRFGDAKRMIADRFGKKSNDDNDLEPEDERLISQAVKDETGSEFVFVTHYPWAKRPFYTKRDPDDSEVTRSFDLLFKGIEITSGGQRINEYDEQVQAMTDKGLDPSDFEQFLRLHQLGTPPHGGLGLGLERLTMQLTNVDNVKRATLFPRDMSRLNP